MKVVTDVGYRYDDILELMKPGFWYTGDEISRFLGQGYPYTMARLGTALTDGKVMRKKSHGDKRIYLWSLA